MVAHGVLQAFSGDEDAGLGWHAPVYGREEAATTIRVSHAGSAPHWIVSVFGVSATNELTGVEVLPVWAEAGALQHSLGVRITRAETTEIFAIAQRQSESTWRVGEIETDAHMLFCRHDGRQISRVALVDGSRVRASGRRGFAVVLPREMPDVHVDLGVDSSEGSSSDGLEARVSNPAPGARVESGGREVPIALERRAAARPRARRLTS
jgi:hypothetical protein